VDKDAPTQAAATIGVSLVSSGKTLMNAGGTRKQPIKTTHSLRIVAFFEANCVSSPEKFLVSLSSATVILTADYQAYNSHITQHFFRYGTVVFS
jgi:hypothetical protein